MAAVVSGVEPVNDVEREDAIWDCPLAWSRIRRWMSDLDKSPTAHQDSTSRKSKEVSRGLECRNIV